MLDSNDVKYSYSYFRDNIGISFYFSDSIGKLPKINIKLPKISLRQLEKSKFILL